MSTSLKVTFEEDQLCNVCLLSSTSTEAVLFCDECEINLCFSCSSKRHSYSPCLIKHNLHFLLLKTEKSSNCQWCKKSQALTECIECRMNFCVECLTNFHRFGTTSLHGDSFQELKDQNETLQSLPPTSIYSPSSSPITHTLHRQDIVEFSLVFFRIAGQDVITPKTNESLFLSLDCPKRMLHLFLKSDNISHKIQSRPFHSLKGVVSKLSEETNDIDNETNDETSTVLYIKFYGLKEFLSILSSTPGLQSFLQQIIRKERVSFPLSYTQNDSYYEGIGYKKGKIQWALRWLVIKKNYLLVFRNASSLVPINTLCLRNVVCNPLHTTQFELPSLQRKFVFKMENEKLRDHVLSILSIVSTSDNDDNDLSSIATETPWTPESFPRSTSRKLTRDDAFHLMEERTQHSPVFFHQSQRREVSINYVDILRRDISKNAQSRNIILGNESIFSEPPLSLSSLPSSVFEFLSELGKSISTGVYLTSHLFLHPRVWFYDKAKISDYSLKKEQISLLNEEIIKIPSNIYDDHFFISLSTYYSLCENVTHTLSNHIAYLHSDMKTPTEQPTWFQSLKGFTQKVVKITENITENITSRHKDLSSYLQICASFYQNSFVFQTWYHQLSLDTQYQEHSTLIMKITEFYRNVIAVMALHDVELLIKDYLKYHKSMIYN